MKAERLPVRHCPVPLHGPQAASMTLLHATRNGSCQAQLLRSDRFPCPPQTALAGPHPYATATAGSFLASTPKEDIVKYAINPDPPSPDPPEFPELTRHNNRNPHYPAGTLADYRDPNSGRSE